MSNKRKLRLMDLPPEGFSPDDPRSGTHEQLEYPPIPMLSLETAILQVDDNVFIYMKYKDIGGEKPIWFTPEVAAQVGAELTRMAEAATELAPAPAPPGSGLIVPQADMSEVLKDLKRNNGN